MHLKHSFKKHFAHSTTRTKTIHAGISAEYLELRLKLEKVASSVKALQKQIDSTKDVYLEVAKHQHTFTDTLYQALPGEGPVREHAKEVENSLRGLQKKIVEEDGSSASHKKIAGVLDSYLEIIKKVVDDYKGLETAYTEVQRYSKKVDKLNKKNKKRDSVSRNMDKLSAARSAYETKLQDVLRQQHATYDKHPVVFQCAHHAFWIAHDTFATIVSETTKAIRWESKALRSRMVEIDVINTPKLIPVPRATLLLPPTKTSDLGSRPLLPGDEITPNSTVHVESEKSPKEVTFSSTSGMDHKSSNSIGGKSEDSVSAKKPLTNVAAILAPEPPTTVPSTPVTVQTVKIPINNLPDPPEGFAYMAAPVVQVTPENKVQKTAIAS